MNPEQIRSGKQAIIARYGPWTAHSSRSVWPMASTPSNSPTGTPDYTGSFKSPPTYLESRSKTFASSTSPALKVSSASSSPFKAPKWWPPKGARRTSRRHDFRGTLGLDNLELVLDDVRNLSVDGYGTFNVVLCLGILYHLDAPDVMDFVRRIASVCEGLVIIDTHIAHREDLTFRWEGNASRGTYTEEHSVNATAEEKGAAKWSSLDNPRSFCLTKASLVNLLRHTGFTSVYECFNPYEFHSVGLAQKPRGARVRSLGEPHHVGGGQGKTVYTALLPVDQPAHRGRPPGAP